MEKMKFRLKEECRGEKEKDSKDDTEPIRNYLWTWKESIYWRAARMEFDMRLGNWWCQAMWKKHNVGMRKEREMLHHFKNLIFLKNTVMVKMYSYESKWVRKVKKIGMILVLNISKEGTKILWYWRPWVSFLFNKIDFLLRPQTETNRWSEIKQWQYFTNVNRNLLNHDIYLLTTLIT